METKNPKIASGIRGPWIYGTRTALRAVDLRQRFLQRMLGQPDTRMGKGKSDDHYDTHQNYFPTDYRYKHISF